MTRRASAPTIRDVAKHAGVSVATVSRVLNDAPRVSTHTRARVQEAVADLGFERSATARSLSLGRTGAIGVVAPFFTTPSVVERLRGVVERFADRGLDLMLYDVEAPGQRAEAFRAFARRDRIDGLLVISLPLTDQEVALLQRDGLPVVLVDVPHPTLPHLAIDDVHGGELATAHLLARGHETIGFVGDASGNAFGFTSSEHRRRGFENALRQAGVEPDPDLQVLGGHGRAEAQALAEGLLGRADRPTAVFAASDMQAIGVLEACDALGLSVPGDVAVIGFDDVEVASVVGLTTVRQPLRESGTRGADLLLARLAGAEPEPPALAPLTVVERRTT